MEQRSLNYRLLFYVALVCTIASALIAYLAGRRAAEAEQRAAAAESKVGKVQYFDPKALAELRDNRYGFVIDNYGFKYQGLSGTLIEDTMLLAGAWEKYMLFFLRDYVAKAQLQDSAFLDVGAEAGVFSFFMAQHMKNVHAFEPGPSQIQRFKKNQELNKFANVTLHEVGLADREALIPFLGDTFHMPARPGSTAEKVNLQVVAGDAWLQKQGIGAVGVIKMDIEGYEEPALKGLRQTMEKQRPLLIVEVSRPPAGTIASFAQLRSLFPEKYGFLYFKKSREGYFNGTYELLDFAPIADDFFARGEQVDIVAYPLEKEALVPRSNAK